MHIGFHLAGGSPLIVGLMRGLVKLGHYWEDYAPGHKYDYVFFFNQCSHDVNYEYKYLNTFDDQKIVFIDTAEFGWDKRFPGNDVKYYNTFASGSMVHDTKNHYQQKLLFNFLNGRSFPYLLREFYKKFPYPNMYHPIDYPLYFYSECHKTPEIEQYCSRDLDLFVSWGLSHPFRNNLTKILRNCHTKCEISVIEEVTEKGITPRMHQDKYFARTRAAKMSVSYDGYGSSSFREMEILCRTMLLKGEVFIKQRNPLVDGVNFVEYKVQITPDNQFCSTDLAQKLRYYLDNPKEAFGIYQNGYNHVHQYYTEQATAQYVLDIAANHDWTVPTPLLLAQE